MRSLTIALLLLSPFLDSAETDFIFSLEPAGGVGNVVELTIPAGEPFTFDVEARLRNENTPPEGLTLDLCGLFSMSVVHDLGLLKLVGVQRGGDLSSDFIAMGAATNDSGRGGFIAANLGMLCNTPLPRKFDGEWSFVRARYTLRLPYGVESIGQIFTTKLQFQDGLRGEGKPVSNRIVDGGAALTPELRDLEIRIHVAENRAFIRGDANRDQVLDISDPVAILHGLFLGDVALPCLDAADANDDGETDLADPIYVFDFLFRGGFPPPAPYPFAGEDPTRDELFCFG